MLVVFYTGGNLGTEDNNLPKPHSSWVAELDLNPEILVPELAVGEDDTGGCASRACAADCAFMG